MTKSNWFKKHPVLLFVALAYGITWLLWIPALVMSAKYGYSLPITGNLITFYTQGIQDTRHLFLALSFSAAVYGPAIAGLIIAGVESGKAGRIGLARRIVEWKVDVKWYVCMVLFAVLIPAVPFLIAIASGMQGITAFPTVSGVLILLLGQLLTSGLGEEVGWRGYLLPKLSRVYKGEKALWIAGLFWAIWHYPFVIYVALTGAGDMPVGAVISLVVTTLAGNTLSLIGMTYIYAWMLKKTDSLLLPIIFHASANVFTTIFAGEQLTLQQPALALLVGFMPWIVALLLGKISGKDAFLLTESK